MQTFECEPIAGYVSLETATFEDLGERTKVTTVSLLYTTEERERHGRLRDGERAQRDLRAPRRAAYGCSDRCGHYRGASSGVLLGTERFEHLSASKGARMSLTKVFRSYT